MSEIYKYKHQLRLPIASSDSMTIGIYCAFNDLYKDTYFNNVSTNDYIIFDNSRINGFLINNAELLQSIAIFTIGNKKYTHEDIAFRKKGSVFNIKHIKHSKFMYDTKYNRKYNGEWWGNNE
jgi:hypothetical protein